MTKLRHALLAATAVIAIGTAANAAEITFKGVDAPTDDAAKRAVSSTTSVTIDGAEHKIGWNTIARSGQKIGNATFGVPVDAAGNIITDASGKPVVSDDADFTSLLPVGNKLFSITHFETRPAAMYLSELSQDANGNLAPISTRPIDLSGIDGLWVPCAGAVTPWGSHLGSEEYPPNAREIDAASSLSEIDDYVTPMARYNGVDPKLMTLGMFREAFKPYRYGFPVEVKVTEAGETSAAKHYAMGRVAVELAYVLPDQKTAYISDDGTNVGLFRFVADKEGDLSSGRLYAAKWNQTSGEGAGAADIEWIDLGHGDNATVRMALNLDVKFNDIFETASFDKDGNCPEGFLSSNAEGRAECLKVKPGMDMLASRLETRRYASMLGATTEFRKMEGIAIDPDGKRLFLAMSEVSNGMEDNAKDGKYDKGGRNDVKLAKNSCGAVYELSMDDNWVVTKAASFVEGKPTKYEEGTPFAGNTCDIDGIANPDNLSFIPGYNTLLIGEDTGSGHQNDATWAVDAATRQMTRIFTSPYGSENTSVDWYPDINGYAYLMTVIQHPYGESDEDKLVNPEDARAYIGYIGPMPAFKKSASLK